MGRAADDGSGAIVCRTVTEERRVVKALGKGADCLAEREQTSEVIAPGAAVDPPPSWLIWAVGGVSIAFGLVAGFVLGSG